MNLKYGGFILFALQCICTMASGQKIIDSYIRIGLDSNLALQQKYFNLQNARLELKKAQAMAYPHVEFTSEYNRASGGRSEEIPIGDLLNDVNATLNRLTTSNKFPLLQNQTLNFIPDNFHDSRVELSVPLINREIRINKQIKKELIHTQDADIEMYKRDLVYDVRRACYRYAQSCKAVSIYSNAMSAVEENLRISERQVKNSIATREVVLRSASQVSLVLSQLTEAVSNRDNAAAWLNFLINRPLNTPVLIDSLPNELSYAAQVNNATFSIAPVYLSKLESAKEVLRLGVRSSRAYSYPKLAAYYHTGFQGFGFNLFDKQFYQLGGLQLKLNIFQGYYNKHAVQQSTTLLASIEVQLDELTKRLNLQATTAFHEYQAAVQKLQHLNQVVQSTQETYRYVELRYQQGQALQLELIDARTKMTNAKIDYSLGQLTILYKAAELEMITNSFKL